MSNLIPVTERSIAIGNIITLWLKAKREASDSVRTEEVYRRLMSGFRARLIDTGYDLDGLPNVGSSTFGDREQSIAKLAIAIEGWATHAVHVESVSANTYNQRIAVLSSFYDFADKRRLLIMDNPVRLLDRRDIQEYGLAKALTSEEIHQSIANLNRLTLSGKRDYALLLIFLSTGRRTNEVLTLQCKHLQIERTGTTIYFDHCKGAKKMKDALEPRVHQALVDYLQTAFECEPEQIESEQFVWLSLSHQSYKKPLSQRGLTDIFRRRFGTTHVYATRYTFALGMSETNTPVTDIQKRHGHSDAVTTRRYLQALRGL